MLIITRRPYEAIIMGLDEEKIDEHIVIMPLSISGSQIRMGIHAPREFFIHRKELLNKILKKEITYDEITRKKTN